MNNFGEMRIFENPALTKTVTTEIIKPWWTKLADNILRWNPCNNWNNPDFKVDQVPSDEAIVHGSNIYIHPEFAARLRATLRKTEVEQSFGFRENPLFNFNTTA